MATTPDRRTRRTAAPIGSRPSSRRRPPRTALPTAAVQLAAPPTDRWTRIQQAVGTLAALGTLAVIVFTWQSLQQVDNEQALTREGQVTDRYNNAVTNLGDKALEVRLGGIYALQRIMKDSPGDQPAIVDVLSTYIRQHARKPKETEFYTGSASDIKAALAALGGRDSKHDGSARVDLNHTFVGGENLRRQNLSGANLSDADLTFADLTGANLRKTFSARADLRFADLTDADLREASLVGATMRGVNLKNTDLRGVDAARADLRFSYLTDADFRKAYLSDTRFRNSELFGADFRQADLDDADFREAKISGADFREAKLYGADFRKADLSNADLRKADLGADLFNRSADLAGADLKGANLEGANLKGANLEGANLKGANLEGANLEGANLKGARR